MKELPPHAQFRAPGKKRREGRGQNFCWDHEHEAVGDGNEAAAYEDVGFAIGVVGAEELIAQANGAAQIGGPGLFGDERVGPGLDNAALDVFGAKNSAEARRGFVKNVFSGAGAAVSSEPSSSGRCASAGVSSAS